jgi:hypothetical protein
VDSSLRSPVGPVSRRLLLPGLMVALLGGAGCAAYESVAPRTAEPEPVVVAPTGEGPVFLQPLAPVRRDIFTRSYRVGEVYTARVGESVVSVKNYSVTERVGHATALRDFRQPCRKLLSSEAGDCTRGPLSLVRGTMGSVFDVIAAVTLPDGQYFAVALPPESGTHAYLLVDPTGRLRRGAYVAAREADSHAYAVGRVPVLEQRIELPLDAEAPLFSFESVERFVFMGPGYLSFDLVFAGRRTAPRGDSYTMMYREFGRDSTDAPAFEQSLVFPVTQQEVEVGRLRIRVETVTPEEIRFSVVEDGQPAPSGR